MRDLSRIVLAAALAVGLWPAWASAQDALNPAISKLDDEVSSFLESVARDDPRRAFKQLLAGSQLISQKEAVEQMVSRAEEIKRLYGPFQEAERVSRKQIGKDVVLLKYLYKCKYRPVVWYVTYYREPSSRTQMSDINPWVVLSLKFDTEVEALANSEK